MSDYNREFKQYNAIANSIEEYRLLVDQIKAQGGHVIHTFTLRDKDRGISVQFMIPVKSN
ncbi:hypothetical protein R4Z09_10840 [Niallia oryzisoli]|uniref:Uncharacterized protein n=1 Tax=Niallia oryzisoli TaxID=1737571 RepID=A0ABZ2CIQ8_9BACI